jgi:ABC-type transporter Mla subunit MlaD
VARCSSPGNSPGTIKSIEFLPVDNDTTRKPAHALGIDASLRDQIRADSKAKVRTLGLLGDKVIDISIGTPRLRCLRRATRSPSRRRSTTRRAGAGGRRGQRHGRSHP